jgi:hypothetical protein
VICQLALVSTLFLKNTPFLIFIANTKAKGIVGPPVTRGTARIRDMLVAFVGG